MVTGVYSSFDFVAEVYSQPWLAPNDKCAIRAFEIATNDPQFVISKSPQDYALFKLAEFDDHTGILTPVNPHIVVKAIDIFSPTSTCSVLSEVSRNVSDDFALLYGSDRNRGAAVGGESPLKQQSENHGVSEMDASKKSTACEVSDTPSSKENEKE